MKNYEELYIRPEDVKKYKVKMIISNIIMYTFMALIALFILFPFYYMLVTSLKTETEAISPELMLWPKSWNWGNYAAAFKLNSRGYSLLTMYRNTLIVAVCTTTGVIVTTVLAAFAFSRLNFKGREFIFSVLLMTMMIPGEIYVVTNYQTLMDLKDSYIVLILPFMTSVFYTFFLRQSFKQIPNELYLAAKVDGLGDYKYLFKVMIPIAKSTIITITILSMIGTWNAYIWPNLMTTDPKYYLISNGLINYFKGLSEGGALDKVVPQQMAMSTLVTVPLLIVFFCLRKYIMSGVSRSGIKG